MDIIELNPSEIRRLPARIVQLEKYNNIVNQSFYDKKIIDDEIIF